MTASKDKKEKKPACPLRRPRFVSSVRRVVRLVCCGGVRVNAATIGIWWFDAYVYVSPFSGALPHMLPHILLAAGGKSRCVVCLYLCVCKKSVVVKRREEKRSTRELIAREPHLFGRKHMCRICRVVGLFVVSKREEAGTGLNVSACWTAGEKEAHAAHMCRIVAESVDLFDCLLYPEKGKAEPS
ncbi:hypothetical protein BDV95DRAFT_57044 [Massariosphaeria phaeospora]|uniref:Uncharacterized protein n=1 Tax=Massariosphaeria phaeospora TaxID=100035 RepID=A0A7C8I5B9_9PLEO|nr:hypothetical protein BDV95DRAFT_57044 [Massariosphaeria phaeospora]